MAGTPTKGTRAVEWRVPLDPGGAAEHRGAIAALVPAWGGVAIADSAKYLGFYVGPGNGLQAWTRPLAKYDERARACGDRWAWGPC